MDILRAEITSGLSHIREEMSLKGSGGKVVFNRAKSLSLMGSSLSRKIGSIANLQIAGLNFEFDWLLSICNFEKS